MIREIRQVRQVRQIKMIAQCCAFLVGCFCGEQSWATDYEAEFHVDLMDKTAKFKGSGDLMTDVIGDNSIELQLPKKKILEGQNLKKRENMNYTSSVNLNCGDNVSLTCEIKYSNDNVLLSNSRKTAYIKPQFKALDISVLKKNGIKRCEGQHSLDLKKILKLNASTTSEIKYIIEIAPYISVTKKFIDAELIERQSGEYSQQVEIPVATNANNITLTLSSCTHSDGTTCQLKHKDTEHKIPIHINNNDGDNEVIINQAITKSQLSTIDNQFILDLKTNKDDMNHAKAGEYKGTIKLKLEASF